MSLSKHLLRGLGELGWGKTGAAPLGAGAEAMAPFGIGAAAMAPRRMSSTVKNDQSGTAGFC